MSFKSTTRLVSLRISSAEKKRWEAEAKFLKMSLSQCIRFHARAAYNWFRAWEDITNERYYSNKFAQEHLFKQELGLMKARIAYGLNKDKLDQMIRFKVGCVEYNLWKEQAKSMDMAFSKYIRFTTTYAINTLRYDTRNTRERKDYEQQIRH